MMTVRTMTVADAPAVANIIRELGWVEHLKEESFDVCAARVADLIVQNQKDRSHSLFIAENQDSEILGYAAVHWLPYLLLKAPEGYVSELFVTTKARGKKVGTALLQKILDDATKRGCSRLTLINVRTRESYQRHFYEKHGWQEYPDHARFVLNL